ncbi:MAG: hypothetical protein R3E79_11330 [Caldilineaceae bacterium]
MRKIRYEILLPAKYNDGRAIMSECMACFPKTLMEVLEAFGALSYNLALDYGRVEQPGATV